MSSIQISLHDDIRKMTAIQGMNIQTYAGNFEQNLVPLLACVLVPKGKKYNEGYDIHKVQRAIWQYLPITDALGLLNEFAVDTLTTSTAILQREIRNMSRMNNK